MANSLTNVIPQLLAQGLQTLREQAVMARIVNRGYEEMAGEKGSTIDIPIPSAITVNNVAPLQTPPTTTPDTSPTKVSITMDQWKEAAFQLSDKDLSESSDGIIPMQAGEAAKSLANTIDSAILANYTSIYGYAGTAGTAPFANDTSEYRTARAALARQLAPLDPRFVIMDPDAENNALGLRAFQDSSFGAGNEVILRGQIGNKMGALWLMNQNIPTHTAGTQNGAYTTDTATYAIGVETLTTITGAGTIVVGDIFTIAGDTQPYVCTTLMTAPGALAFSPPLKVAIAASATAITVKATHAVNLVIHRDCMALAMRPFNGADPVNVGNFSSMVDPVSGLVLRLEVTREHKRTRFSYDALYGVGIPRPELGARIAG